MFAVSGRWESRNAQELVKIVTAQLKAQGGVVGLGFWNRVASSLPGRKPRACQDKYASMQKAWQA